MNEPLRQIAESIAEHPRRVAASSLGVFWGAAALVLLMSFATGFREFMRAELGRFGERLVLVHPAFTSSGFPGFGKGVPVEIDRLDVAAVERATSQFVEALLPEHRSDERVRVEGAGRVRRLDLSGADGRFARYRNFEIASGRFLDADDVAKRRAVAVIGFEAARDLYGRPELALGRTLRIEGQPFELVGIAARKGRQYMNTHRPDNRLLIVPVSTAEARLGFRREAVESLLLAPRPGVSGATATRAVLAALGPLSGFHPQDADAIKAYDTGRILGMTELFYAGFMVFIGIAGTITLLVGAVGIANYHLATLAERTVEIAVAKAVGARNRVLVAQTVLESVAVSGAATLLGVALGLLACLVLEVSTAGQDFPRPIVSGLVVLVTAAASLAVGVVAAVAPALRVRDIDVSVAMRSAL